MTVTLINVGGTPIASIQRPDGGAMDENGVISAGEFGISGTTAYFDTNGATIGQGAALGFDGSIGQLFLKSGTVNDQPHLMLLRQEAREHHVSTPVDYESRVLRQGARDEWVLDAPAFDNLRQQVRDHRVSTGVDQVSQGLRQQTRRGTPDVARDDGSANRARNEAWRRSPASSDIADAQVASNSAAEARNAAWRRPPAAWADGGGTARNELRRRPPT